MSVVSNVTKRLHRLAGRARVALRSCLTERRGAFALEFAMVAPVFFLLLFVVFEVAYDEFMQEVLDNTLQSAARQVQIGNTQSSTAATFVQNYMCPYDNGLFNCNNLFVRVQEIEIGPTAAGSGSTCTASTDDFYDATTATDNSNAPTNSLPVDSTGTLQLGAFYSGAGTQGVSSDLNLSPCATTTSASGYCNVGGQQFIMMTAVYVAPSFLDGLVLRHVTYGGHYVRALVSSAAFETEPFSSAGSTPAC